MKKLLVPTDFSDEAYQAIDVAAYIAKKICAEVVLFNVLENFDEIEVQNGANYKIDETEQMNALTSMKVKLMSIEKVLRKSGVRAKSEVELDFEHLSANVAEVITKRDDCDLIVMGSKGAHGVKEFFIGSNTEKVVEKAHVPVLAVKKFNPDFKIENVLFPTDFVEYSETVVKFVKQFANDFNAKLHLLYINIPKYFLDEKEIELYFDKFKLKFGIDNCTTHSYSAHKEEDGILNFAETLGADVIFMPTNGRTGLSKLINGSVTSSTINHGNIPILTINTNHI